MWADNKKFESETLMFVEIVKHLIKNAGTVHFKALLKQSENQQLENVVNMEGELRYVKLFVKNKN